jgi:enoyl-CoA hydratase/carnithine racemase
MISLRRAHRFGSGYTHEEFVELFHQIGEDEGNRVVILTGAGEAFIDRIEAEGFDFYSRRGYDKICREGKKVLLNLVDIPVPVIAALNGPTTVPLWASCRVTASICYGQRLLVRSAAARSCSLSG